MGKEPKVRLDVRISEKVKLDAERHAANENRPLGNHVETVLKRDNEARELQSKHQPKKEYGKQ
jgi:hypothetical protein